MELRSGSVSSIDNIVISGRRKKQSTNMSTIQYSINDVMEQVLKNGRVIDGIEADISALKMDVSKVKKEHAEMSTTVNNVVTRLDKVELDVNTGDDCLRNKVQLTMDALRRTQIATVDSQYHSMQYNVIAYNVKLRLADGKTRESNDKSVDCAYHVLENCFGIHDARTTIPLSIAHRLPSTSITSRPPLIFKLLYLSDKQRLWANIKQVKDYNKDRLANDKISIQMIQLPSKLAHDKQSLKDDFDAARNAGDKPKWRYIRNSGQYCYTINEVYYKPKVDYFLHKFVSKAKEN